MIIDDLTIGEAIFGSEMFTTVENKEKVFILIPTNSEPAKHLAIRILEMLKMEK